MPKEHDRKTNAMRVLDAAGARYRARFFECPEALSGVEVARLLELDEDRVFKTLVTAGKSGEHFAFMVPVACELDLKKAAEAVGEKSIAMVKARELLPLTGYVHGGCSPIGMKKQFVTRIDSSAEKLETMIVSGGRIGSQLELTPENLARAAKAEFAEIIRK